MNIRTERAADYDEVFHLNVLAFQNREDESRLVERIRSSKGFVSELSLVAEEDGHIVGHALFSKAEILEEDIGHEVLVLAPIAVMPSHQKNGIGRKLILEGLKRSKDLGFDYIFLIGHPAYYPKFGFKPARPYGFELKQFAVPDDVFMFLPLSEGKTLQGELKYPEAFF